MQALRIKFVRRPLGICLARSLNRFATAEIDSVSADLLDGQKLMDNRKPKKGDLLLAIDGARIAERRIAQ